MQVVVLLIVASAALPCEGREAKELMYGDRSLIYTPTEFLYNRYWLQVLEREFVTFKLRACSDGHLFFAQTSGNYTFYTTEVVIGGWYNTRSVIRQSNFGDWVFQADTPGILHCNEFRTFWASWSNGIFMVGRGPIFNQQTFLQANRIGALDHSIGYVGVSTGFGASGTWDFEQNSGYWMIFLSPDSFKYTYLWKTMEYASNFYSFEIMACSDVHVALGPAVGVPVYEVVLGGWSNTRSVIRLYRADEKASYDEANIVQCLANKQFWITWADSTIKVGKGDTPGSQEILSYKEETMRPISAMSYTTGYGSTGRWGFSEDLENQFTVWTVPENVDDFNINTWIVASRQTFASFNVEACSDVFITWNDRPYMTNEMKNSIYLGSDTNTKSGIVNFRTGERFNEKTTPGILSCTRAKPFWISWKNGLIEIGRGVLYGYNLILSWDVSDQAPIHCIGLRTIYSSGAKWIIRRNAGDQMYLYTPDNYNLQNAWLSVRQQYYQVFQISAEKEAHIVLTAIKGLVSEYDYDVVIGMENGEWTRIRKKDADGQVLAEQRTPGIIKSGEYRHFWIGWLDNYIRVGKGWKFGQQVLVEMAEPMPRSINFLSISTFGNTGNWLADGDKGDYMHVSVSTESVTKWIQLYPGTDWVYFRMSGKAARIALGNYRDKDSAYILISGSNGMLLTRGGRNLFSSSDNVMNESELKSFWISWTGGKIKAGRGRYRDWNTMIDYGGEGGAPKVVAMGLAATEGSTVDYFFLDNFGKEITYDTPGGQDFQQIWASVRHTNYAVFSVAGCASANVLLSTVMFSVDNDHNYLFIIGDEQNTKTTLRTGGTGKDIAITSMPTPDVLNCDEERFFWASWYSGHLSLGTGVTVGSNVIFSWQDMSPTPVHALSFASSDGNTAIWRYSLTEVPFEEVPYIKSARMSGGEIAALVIGFLILFALFGAVVYAIFYPPAPLQPYLAANSPMGPASSGSGFGNPLNAST